MNEEKNPPLQFREVVWGTCAVLFAASLFVVVAYHFLAPPKTLSLDEAAALWKQKEAGEDALATEEAKRVSERARCGPGMSGLLCNLGRGVCDTALGSYFCLLEGRNTDTVPD